MRSSFAHKDTVTKTINYFNWSLRLSVDCEVVHEPDVAYSNITISSIKDQQGNELFAKLANKYPQIIDLLKDKCYDDVMDRLSY